MIALTGKEEADIRRFVECLEVKPPLVNILRRAVADFIQNRLLEDPLLCRRWNEKCRAEIHLSIHR